MMSGSAWNRSQSFCQKFPGDSSRQPCSGSRLRSFLRPGSRSVTCRQTSSRLLVPELCRRQKEASVVSASTGPAHCTYRDLLSPYFPLLSLKSLMTGHCRKCFQLFNKRLCNCPAKECTGALKLISFQEGKCVRAHNPDLY